jgi:plastocyanin
MITSAAATVVLGLAGVLLAGGPRPALAATGIVQIHDFGFLPQEMHIGAGDSVVWSNTGEVNHAVRFDEPGTGSGRDRLSPEEGYVHTFDQPGSYRYHCRLYPTMAGVVVVGEKGSRVTPPPAPPSSPRPVSTTPTTRVERARVRVAVLGQPVEVNAPRRSQAAGTEPSATSAAPARGPSVGEVAPPAPASAGPGQTAGSDGAAANPLAAPTGNAVGPLRRVDTGSPKVSQIGILLIASGIVWLSLGLRRRSLS